jgi:hypothetical protein
MTEPGISDIHKLRTFSDYKEYYDKTDFGKSIVSVQTNLIIVTPYDKDLLKIQDNRVSFIEGSKNKSVDTDKLYNMMFNDIEYNDFSKLFFSENNVKNIQKLLIFNVSIYSDGYIIDAQNWAPIALHMRKTYLKYLSVPKNKEDYKYKIDFLNKKIIEELVPLTINAIRSHYNFIINRDKIEQKPEQTSTDTRGTRGLLLDMSKRFFS